MDGLFAGGPTFDLCHRYGWKFMIVLKDDDLPSVNEEFDALSKLQPENRLAWRTGKEAPIKQVFRWVDDVDLAQQKTRPSDYWRLGEMPPWLNQTLRRSFKNDSKSVLILLDPLGAPVASRITPTPIPIRSQSTHRPPLVPFLGWLLPCLVRRARRPPRTSP
jgi:hypothetical protein